MCVRVIQAYTHVNCNETKEKERKKFCRRSVDKLKSKKKKKNNIPSEFVCRSVEKNNSTLSFGEYPSAVAI